MGEFVVAAVHRGYPRHAELEVAHLAHRDRLAAPRLVAGHRVAVRVVPELIDLESRDGVLREVPDPDRRDVEAAFAAASAPRDRLGIADLGLAALRRHERDSLGQPCRETFRRGQRLGAHLDFPRPRRRRRRRGFLFAAAAGGRRYQQGHDTQKQCAVHGLHRMSSRRSFAEMRRK